jgi:hypothetical protein
MATVKVAVNLAGVSALSLLFETHHHPLDLTPSVSTPVAGLLELCPRGNNKDVIIIILVHDNVYIPC